MSLAFDWALTTHVRRQIGEWAKHIDSVWVVWRNTFLSLQADQADSLYWMESGNGKMWCNWFIYWLSWQLRDIRSRHCVRFSPRIAWQADNFFFSSSSSSFFPFFFSFFFFFSPLRVRYRHGRRYTVFSWPKCTGYDFVILSVSRFWFSLSLSLSLLKFFPVLWAKVRIWS